jgi:hypothetical protein
MLITLSQYINYLLSLFLLGKVTCLSLCTIPNLSTKHMVTFIVHIINYEFQKLKYEFAMEEMLYLI